MSHFRRAAAVILAATLFVAPGEAAGKPDKPSGGGENVIETVNVQTSGKFTQVVFQSSRPLKYRDMASPDGVILYMSEPVLCQKLPIEKAFSDLVEEIRYVYRGAKTPENKPIPLDSIVLKLKEKAGYSITQRDWILVVELKPREGAAAVSVEGPTLPVVSEAVAPLPSERKGKKLAVLPPNPTLADILTAGLANHVPYRLADEEYRLAGLRWGESLRSLFPAVSGKYETSSGRMLKDVTLPDDDVMFKRREIGVQVGQPIFQSGRLYYSLRQAGMQKRVAAFNVQKIRADISFEIVKAYHNLIKTQRVVKIRREMGERMAKVIEMARKKRQLELITESEMLGAESQYSQSYYRLLSDEKDGEIARLRLETLLNVPDPLPTTLPEPERFNPKKMIDLNVPVETFIHLGLGHRPEVLVAENTARMNAYAEKVAKAEGRLRVDASGFLGRAGGAFDTEELKMRRSWNAGVQASLSFFGNTFKGNGSKERSTPDFGETTATETTARSASMGFLDGFKQVADRRQATINKERSAFEWEQARRNTEVDVREAYYNVQKAKIQIKGAQQELDYREKDLAIAHQKERMNLVDPAQGMQAESAYGEAVSGYEDAVAFYRVSLASLEKAVGMALEAIPELK